MTDARLNLICALLGLLGCISLAPASPATVPGRPAAIVTRADLAEAYTRLEQTLRTHPPADDDRTRVHRAMDRAAYQFFAANHASSLQTMNQLSDSLRGAAEPDLTSFIQSLKIRVSPTIAQTHRPSIFSVRMVPIYDVPLKEPIELKFVLKLDGPEGKVVFEEPIEFRSDAPLPSITTRQPDVPPGRYLAQLVAPDGQTFDVARWFLVARSFDNQRAANEKRLIGVDTRDPRMYQAWIACRARNALLSDRPSEDDLAQYSADPIELAREVNEEVESLLKGRDPYLERVGEYYRAIPAGAMIMPARVYAPASVKEGKPLPLVIALHGAGADELIFMRGYGDGQIKRLADKHGFIVVAPSTYWVMPNPSALDGIVAAISADYEIDRSRIYIVGHSLGGMAASGMVRRQPDAVAAAVLIAGGQFSNGDESCPVLMLAAEHDRIILPERLAKAAEQAQSAGLPVEYRLIEGAGHVLICNEMLDDSVEWLLQHRAPAKR